jgi:hypothetical protein
MYNYFDIQILTDVRSILIDFKYDVINIYDYDNGAYKEIDFFNNDGKCLSLRCKMYNREINAIYYRLKMG